MPAPSVRSSSTPEELRLHRQAEAVSQQQAGQCVSLPQLARQHARQQPAPNLLGAAAVLRRTSRTSSGALVGARDAEKA